MVFYESPHRIVRTIRDLADRFGSDREAAVVREISKKCETLYRATLGELLVDFEANQPKGEFVIIVDGKKKTRSSHKEQPDGSQD